MRSEGDKVWRTETAERVRVIVDAEDYFRWAREAMLLAKKRIFLIGWDFDARILLVRDGLGEGEPASIGEFIYWLVERTPQLEVFLLRWDVGAFKAMFRGTTPMTLIKWMRHPRIHTKLDSAHPHGGSHHQKIIVIDDCFAFCGGIDMTGDRWDTRHHRDVEDWRRRPGSRGQPYKPWHDATSALEGPVAAALGDLGRQRWERAGGKPMHPVLGHFECWPKGLEPHFTSIPVSIARTRPAMPDCPEVREIEALFVEQIATARESIYAESQYFASRKIAEAIAARLRQPDCPEIVIVNPVTAQGWLEPIAMDTARARLITALGKLDARGRFKLYHPVTEGGEPIYVHAKIMIVDGKTLRIGSANMNNRSLGLDSECDVVVEARDAGEEAAICTIRDGLIAEHLGVDEAAVTAEIAASGSIIATIEKLRGQGRSLREYEAPDLSGVEKWLADNEVLDPESPSEMFEATSKRGLFRRFRRGGSGR